MSKAKKPQAEEEIVIPNKIKTSWGKPMMVPSLALDFPRQKVGTARILAFSDIHAPFHDRRAIELACEVVKEVKPQAIVYIGDAIDFYAVSHFDKDPRRLLGLQEEIDAFQAVDRQVASVAGPDIRRYLLLGNHEIRLERYLWQHPEFSQLRGVQFDALIGLDQDFKPIPGLQIVREEINWRNRFIFTHGTIVRKWGAYSAKAELDKFSISGCSGHTHRVGMTVETTRIGSRMWAEIGCLAELNPEYCRNPNWAHGMGLLNVSLTEADFFQFAPICFSKNQTIVNGKLIKV